MFSKKLEKLIKVFISFQTVENARSIGKEMTKAELSIEEKKSLYDELFSVVTNESVEAVLNLWAIASMIEDQLPVTKKILAVRNFIKDPYLERAWIEEWIEVVWSKRAVNKDFLEFIAIDLRNIPDLREDLKTLLYEFDYK